MPPCREATAANTSGKTCTTGKAGEKIWFEQPFNSAPDDKQKSYLIT